MRLGLSLLSILAIALGLVFAQSLGPAVKEVRVAAGETADLWFGVNVKGRVHYVIRTKDGSNQMRMWWITEPLGTVKQLRTLKNSGSLDIPGKLNASITAKLRGMATVDTLVYIGENVQVGNTMTFKW
jgi:hypothetical protein